MTLSNLLLLVATLMRYFPKPDKRGAPWAALTSLPSAHVTHVLSGPRDRSHTAGETGLPAHPSYVFPALGEHCPLSPFPDGR